MEILNWLIGPQLLGIVFLLLGLIFKYFPPKQINKWYGYRTPSSMINQQAWDAANRYSADYMIRAGLICIVAGFVITALLMSISMAGKIKLAIMHLSFLATSMGTVLTMLTSTERYLEKTFKQNTK